MFPVGIARGAGCRLAWSADGGGELCVDGKHGGQTRVVPSSFVAFVLYSPLHNCCVRCSDLLNVMLLCDFCL